MAVPNTELVHGLGVDWYLRVKRKGLKNGYMQEYIYLVKVVCESGKCYEYSIGNAEEIDRIMSEIKKKDERPYARKRGRGAEPSVAPRAGFEPARGLPHRLSRPAP